MWNGKAHKVIMCSRRIYYVIVPHIYIYIIYIYHRFDEVQSSFIRIGLESRVERPTAHLVQLVYHLE